MFSTNGLKNNCLVNNQINQYNIKTENLKFGGKNEEKICDFFEWRV